MPPRWCVQNRSFCELDDDDYDLLFPDDLANQTLFLSVMVVSCAALTGLVAIGALTYRLLNRERD